MPLKPVVPFFAPNSYLQQLIAGCIGNVTSLHVFEVIVSFLYLFSINFHKTSRLKVNKKKQPPTSMQNRYTKRNPSLPVCHDGAVSIPEIYRIASRRRGTRPTFRPRGTPVGHRLPSSRVDARVHPWIRNLFFEKGKKKLLSWFTHIDESNNFFPVICNYSNSASRIPVYSIKKTRHNYSCNVSMDRLGNFPLGLWLKQSPSYPDIVHHLWQRVTESARDGKRSNRHLSIKTCLVP